MIRNTQRISVCTSFLKTKEPDVQVNNEGALHLVIQEKCMSTTVMRWRAWEGQGDDGVVRS